jgi:transposase/transposase-like protein
MTYSVDLKNRAIKMYLDRRVGTLRYLESILDIGKSTLHRWINEHPLTRRISNRRVGRPQALGETMKESFRRVVHRSPFATSRDILASLRDDFPSISIAPSTICRWRKRLGFTKKFWYAAAVEDELIAPLRTAFSDEVGKLNNWDDVVSIDESAFFLDMKPSYGYSPRGCRLSVRKQRRHKTRFTLLLAVASNGVVGYEFFPGSCKSGDFAQFVSTLTVPAGTRLLMDNASIHKTHAVKEAMRRREIIPTFLPPYTPQWQPVEYCFSVLKNAYRRNRCDSVDVEERIIASLLYMDSDTEKFGNVFRRCHRLAHRNILDSI